MFLPRSVVLASAPLSLCLSVHRKNIERISMKFAGGNHYQQIKILHFRQRIRVDVKIAFMGHVAAMSNKCRRLVITESIHKISP